MKNLEKKLLDRCINDALKTLKQEGELKIAKEIFKDISLKKEQNNKILTNWSLSSITKKNLNYKLGTNLEIINNDEIYNPNYEKFFQLLDDEDSNCFVQMMEFVPHYMGGLLKRDKTFFNSSDIDLNLPGFFSNLFYKKNLKNDFFISCLGFDEAAKFKNIYKKNAFVNPFLFTGLTFLRWYDYFTKNYVSQKYIEDEKVFFTGTIFNTLMGKKLDFLLKNCSKLEELDIKLEFIDGHLSLEKYHKILSSSLVTLCHCRFKDSILTRAIDAYVCGSVPILDNSSLTNSFLKENSFISFDEFEDCFSKNDFKKLIINKKYKPSMRDILETAISNIKTGIILEIFYKELSRKFTSPKKIFISKEEKLPWKGNQKFYYINKRKINTYLFAGRQIAVPNFINVNFKKFKSEKNFLKKYPNVKISKDINIKINRTAYTNTLKHYAFRRIYDIYSPKESNQFNIIDLCISFLHKKENLKERLSLNDNLTSNLLFEISQTITKINLSCNNQIFTKGNKEYKSYPIDSKVDNLFLKLNSLFRISLCSSNLVKPYDLLSLIEKSIISLELINIGTNFADNIMSDTKYLLPFDFLSNTFNNHFLIDAIIENDPLLYKKTLLASFYIIRFCLTGLKNDLTISINYSKNTYILNLIDLLDLRYLESIKEYGKNSQSKNLENKSYRSNLKKIFFNKFKEDLGMPNQISKISKFLFI